MRIPLWIGLAGCAAGAERTTTQAASATPASSKAAAPVVGAPMDAPKRAAVPPRGIVTCPFEGELAIRAGEKLLLGESADVEARFTGHRVHVDVERIDTAKGPVATAIVRAPSSPPALRLHAKLRADAIPFRAAREIRVAGGFVTIPRGTALAVSSGEDGALGVKQRYGDFGGVTAAATCDDVELGEATLHGPGPRRATPMHVTGKRVTLFVAPDGANVVDLETRHERRRGRVPSAQRMSRREGRTVPRTPQGRGPRSAEPRRPAARLARGGRRGPYRRPEGHLCAYRGAEERDRGSDRRVLDRRSYARSPRKVTPDAAGGRASSRVRSRAP